MTLPQQPNEIDALLDTVPDALVDEFATASIPVGMQPETVYPRQQQQEIRQRRRTLKDTLLSLALDGQDERFKNKVYELVVELKLDPDDPLFLMLVATGRLDLLLEEHPGELSTLFDQWEERVYGQLQHYQQGLEQYERTAVKAQQKAIAESVHTLIRKTTFDKLVHTFSAASTVIASTLLLVAVGVGGALGIAWSQAQQAQMVYAPSQPRQLTLEEANALHWAMGADGRFAKHLLEWNRDLLNVQGKTLPCEQQTKQLGVTLELQGQKASQGACVLWVRPVGDRQLQSIKSRQSP
jgi:hypothetical protein